MKNVTQESTLSGWAIVECYRNKVYAGRVGEEQIGGDAMVRVDVPTTETAPAFSKLLGVKSICSITPVDEATAREVARRQRPNPLKELGLEALGGELDFVRNEYSQD